MLGITETKTNENKVGMEPFPPSSYAALIFPFIKMYEAESVSVKTKASGKALKHFDILKNKRTKKNIWRKVNSTKWVKGF